MCSQNQRVRPDCRRNAVGSRACNESWRLMMQRKRARGVGGVTGRSSTTKSSARRALIASSAGSRAGVQGAVAAFTAAPGSGPGLREVFGCWNYRAKMWPGQQAALRAFASARQWCVHGVSRILAMPSTSEIRLAGRQRVLAQSICSKSAFTECGCAVVWMETLLPLLYGARGGAEPRQQSAYGLPNWVSFFRKEGPTHWTK